MNGDAWIRWVQGLLANLYGCGSHGSEGNDWYTFGLAPPSPLYSGRQAIPGQALPSRPMNALPITHGLPGLPSPPHTFMPEEDKHWHRSEPDIGGYSGNLSPNTMYRLPSFREYVPTSHFRPDNLWEFKPPRPPNPRKFELQQTQQDISDKPRAKDKRPQPKKSRGT
jgi:hypothetical protein